MAGRYIGFGIVIRSFLAAASQAFLGTYLVQRFFRRFTKRRTRLQIGDVGDVACVLSAVSDG